MNEFFERNGSKSLGFFFDFVQFIFTGFFLKKKKNNDSVTGFIDILAEKLKNFERL